MATVVARHEDLPTKHRTHEGTRQHRTATLALRVTRSHGRKVEKEKEVGGKREEGGDLFSRVSHSALLHVVGMRKLWQAGLSSAGTRATAPASSRPMMLRDRSDSH